MKVVINKEGAYWIIVAIGVIVALSNVIFMSNAVVGTVIALIELALLFLLLLTHSYSLFLALYVVFMATCLEFEALVAGEIYNLKSIRFLGINLGIYILLPIIIIALINLLKDSNFRKRYLRLWSVVKMLIGVNLIAAVIGLMGILVNDNNIRGLEGYFEKYIGEVYEMIFFPVGLFGAMYMAIKYDNKKLYLLQYSLQATLFALAIQVIIPSVCDIFGYYGGTTYTLAATTSVFLPLALLLPFQRGCVKPKTFFVMMVIAVAFSLFYGASGKSIIVIGIVFVFLEIFLLSNKKVIAKLTGIILIGIVIISIPTVFSILSENILFRAKMGQVKLLFSFGEGWLSKLPVSPKIRVGEMINIFYEYTRKPWYILTGKGYLGSIKDYVGIFSEMRMSAGSFTETEWNNGIFYAMHEILQMVLTYGLMGMLMLIRVIKMCIREFKTNIWSVFGVYWVTMFYGYSVTLSTFGIVAFYFGFYLTDIKYEKRKVITSEVVG